VLRVLVARTAAEHLPADVDAAVAAAAALDVVDVLYVLLSSKTYDL
jgi:hypothetical protein